MHKCFNKLICKVGLLFFVFSMPFFALAQEGELAKLLAETQTPKSTLEGPSANATSYANANSTEPAQNASSEKPLVEQTQGGEVKQEAAGKSEKDHAANLAQTQGADPLVLWSDTASKKAIIAFVQAAITPGKGFIEPENRIAAFDHDGTLVPEYPSYFQLFYALERFKAEAFKHPEWQTTQIYKELLAGDLDTALALNAKKTFEILVGLTAHDTPDLLARDIGAWLKTSYPDERFAGRSFAQMTYAPMQELLRYLKANGFSIYLVTGSEIEFSRALAAALYKLPPDQVIGSQLRQKFEFKDGKNQLVREPRLDMINDGLAKPENLQARLGRAPVFVFGNSDGDLPMLQWVGSAPGPRLVLVLHHNDAEREYAYANKAKNGKLRKALDQAKANKWIVVDMKKDWQLVFEE